MNNDPRFRLGDDGELVPIENENTYDEKPKRKAKKVSPVPREPISESGCFSQIRLAVLISVVGFLIYGVFLDDNFSSLDSSSLTLAPTQIPTATPTPYITLNQDGSEPPFCYNSPIESDNRVVLDMQFNNDIDTNELYIFDPVDGLLCRLTQDEFYNADPSWSPDGNMILYSSSRTIAVHEQVNLVNSSGLVFTNWGADTIPTIDFYTSFQWSPDGTQIAFAVGEQYTTYANTNIIVIDGDNGDMITLNEETYGYTELLQWLPDGQLLFKSNRPSEDESGNILTLPRLYSIDSETGEVIRILDTSLLRSNSSVRFSPDMSQIIFTAYDRIFVADANGRNETILSPSRLLAGDPQWIDNGARIAFRGRVGTGNWGLYVMDADGGNLQRVTSEVVGWQLESFDWWTAD